MLLKRMARTMLVFVLPRFVEVSWCAKGFQRQTTGHWKVVDRVPRLWLWRDGRL